MNKRKSPKIHRVKTHIKNGKRVNSYVRGSRRITTTNLSNPTPYQKPKGYTVTFKYNLQNPNDKETIKVIATNWHRALDEAFEEKVDKRQPLAISVIDPSLHEVVSWAGKRALEYGKKVVGASKDLYRDVTDIALSHTATTDKGLAGALAKKQLERRSSRDKTEKERRENENVQKFIKEAYSKDKTVRAYARMKLRTRFPEVWDVMDISRK